jgi:hypothetical protein
MAAADTIVVLDGIQHAKDTNDDVYTQDHATNSSVFCGQFHVPLAYKAVRVVYNGAYDPDGGRVHYRTKLLRTTSISTPTKTANQQDEWLTLTPPAVAESTAFDVSASWDSILCIDVCQSSTTANTTGIEIIIQGRKEDSLDEWSTIHSFNVLALGAATKSDFADTEAADQTTLSITNPTTGNLDHVGKFIFLEDTGTIAQCEIAFITECGADS